MLLKILRMHAKPVLFCIFLGRFFDKYITCNLQIISVIGLGCATNGCMVDEYSIFNNDANACRFAVAVTLLGFLFSLISLVSDYMYDKTANIKRRRYILISDIGGTGTSTQLLILRRGIFSYIINWKPTFIII